MDTILHDLSPDSTPDPRPSPRFGRLSTRQLTVLALVIRERRSALALQDPDRLLTILLGEIQHRETTGTGVSR